MFFDVETKFAVKISNRTVEKTGNKGAKMYFYVNNPKDFVEFSFLPHIPKGKYKKDLLLYRVGPSGSHE